MVLSYFWIPSLFNETVSEEEIEKIVKPRLQKYFDKKKGAMTEITLF